MSQLLCEYQVGNLFVLTLRFVLVGIPAGFSTWTPSDKRRQKWMKADSDTCTDNSGGLRLDLKVLVADTTFFQAFQ